MNALNEFTCYEIIKKHLSGVAVAVGEALPENRDDYDLIILWSYRKIIPNLNGNSNVVIFHSSDLPEGKGWAPIFYTIAEGLEYYTVTGILAADKVDAGDIIVKARFKMKDDYTADILRIWDHEISVKLIRMILDKFDGTRITGKKQEGKGTYRSKRTPEKNEIALDMKMSEALNILRASEKGHPAFVLFNGVKYNLHLAPASAPAFPADLEVIFYSGQ